MTQLALTAARKAKKARPDEAEWIDQVKIRLLEAIEAEEIRPNATNRRELARAAKLFRQEVASLTAPPKPKPKTWMQELGELLAEGVRKLKMDARWAWTTWIGVGA